MNAWWSSVADAWGHTLWQLSWQIVVLSAFIWLVSLLCRRLPANFQYWLWCIVLLRLCVPIQYSIPTGITDDVRQTAELCLLSVLDPPPAEPVPSRLEDARALKDEATLTTVKAATAWTAIVTLLAAAVSIRIFWIRRALRESPLISRPDLLRLVEKLRSRCGIRRAVRLRRSSSAFRVRGPAVTGFFRPTIVLPSQMVEHWSPLDLEPVILHEMGHIKRGDLWMNLLQIAVQTVYFFHPLVWYVNWRIRQVREEVCDDLAVLHLGGERKRYGTSLLRVIEECDPNRKWAFVQTNMAEPKTSLGRRVVRVMNKDYHVHRSLSLRAVLGLALIGLCAIGVAGGSSRDVGAAASPAVSALADKAEALFVAKDYSEAIEVYKTISKDYPKTNEAANAAMMIGICLDWKGDKEKSLAALEEAAESYPDKKGWSEAIWFYLADARRRAGRNEDAVKAYGKCVELCKGVREPDRFPYADALGWIELTPAEVLFETGRYDEATKAYTAIAEEYPDWNYAEHALMMVGLCHERTGDRDKAIEAYRAAVSKYPDLKGWTEATLYYLGHAYECTGKTDEALDAYHRCVKLCEKAPGRKPEGFPWNDAQQRINALEGGER
ncbi:MAG: tetratricopeptide repeat protein [Candidatus Hydrogenedentes bacterium]|nr:tetratricopeptide repeat protein [Candidatus Hydrogenedentota bacterium]